MHQIKILAIVFVVVAGLVIWKWERINLYWEAFKIANSKRVTISKNEIKKMRLSRAVTLNDGVTVLPEDINSIDEENYFGSAKELEFRRIWKPLLSKTTFKPGVYSLSPTVRKDEGPAGCELVNQITVTADHIRALRIIFRFEGWTTFDLDVTELAKVLGHNHKVDDQGLPILNEQESAYYQKLIDEAVYVLQAFLQHGDFKQGRIIGDIEMEDMLNLMLKRSDDS